MTESPKVFIGGSQVAKDQEKDLEEMHGWTVSKKDLSRAGIQHQEGKE